MFAEILRLLDPTAVRPDGTFDPKHVENLIIRRHRHSSEVAQEVGAASPSEAKETEALTRLSKLAEAANSAKSTELVSYLKKIGVGKGSKMRAVVFAERVATLKWLQETLPKALGLKPENVGLLHGGLSDVEQQSIVDQFKRGNSPLRVLVTGAVASE